MSSAYVCYNLDLDMRMLSSSGGLYPLIARELLAEGGVVYAACYDKDLNVVHREITSFEGIEASQGSKYVASDLGNTFREIYEKTLQGKKVLFVGTPCQCNGLISYSKLKKIDRSKIVVVDFACHGIPSPLVWRSYLKSMQNKGKKILSVNMRDKSSGWSKCNYSWNEKISETNSITTFHRNVPYMKGMLANLTIRQSCTSCPFKGIDRCTDLTLGDYWGVWDYQPEMDDNRGTSIVLVHSEEGQRLISSVSDHLKIKEAYIDKAVMRNKCIVESAQENPERSIFFDRLKNGEDFIKVINEMTKEKVSEKIIRKLRAMKHKVWD